MINLKKDFFISKKNKVKKKIFNINFFKKFFYFYFSFLEFILINSTHHHCNLINSSCQ